MSQEFNEEYLNIADNDGLSNNSDFIEDNIVPLSTESISKCVFDKDLFQLGVKEVSKLCGSISALVNIGINPCKAMDYLIDKEASKDMMENSVVITKIQADATVESSKYESANIQKSML